MEFYVAGLECIPYLLLPKFGIIESSMYIQRIFNYCKTLIPMINFIEMFKHICRIVACYHWVQAV